MHLIAFLLLVHEHALAGLLKPPWANKPCLIAIALRPWLRPSWIASRNGSQALADGMGLGLPPPTSQVHPKPGGHLVGRQRSDLFHFPSSAEGSTRQHPKLKI